MQLTGHLELYSGCTPQTVYLSRWSALPLGSLSLFGKIFFLRLICCHFSLASLSHFPCAFSCVALCIRDALALNLNKTIRHICIRISRSQAKGAPQCCTIFLCGCMKLYLKCKHFSLSAAAIFCLPCCCASKNASGSASNFGTKWKGKLTFLFIIMKMGNLRGVVFFVFSFSQITSDKLWRDDYLLTDFHWYIGRCRE